MREEYQLIQKKEILRFALFLGELMLTNGVETSRAEDSVLRVVLLVDTDILMYLQLLRV